LLLIIIIATPLIPRANLFFKNALIMAQNTFGSLPFPDPPGESSSWQYSCTLGRGSEGVEGKVKKVEGDREGEQGSGPSGVTCQAVL